MWIVASRATWFSLRWPQSANGEQPHPTTGLVPIGELRSSPPMGLPQTILLLMRRGSRTSWRADPVNEQPAKPAAGSSSALNAVQSQGPHRRRADGTSARQPCGGQDSLALGMCQLKAADPGARCRAFAVRFLSGHSAVTKSYGSITSAFPSRSAEKLCKQANGWRA